MPGIEGLTQRVLVEGRLSVVATRNHPLAGQPRVRPGDPLKWPWILPGTRSITRTASAVAQHAVAQPA